MAEMAVPRRQQPSDGSFSPPRAAPARRADALAGTEPPAW
jgi:hypothetical protein